VKWLIALIVAEEIVRFAAVLTLFMIAVWFLAIGFADYVTRTPRVEKGAAVL
jgi:hypothetical protein